MSLDVSRFRVRCRCGAAAEGPRLPRAQVVACPACRARLFVFPTGPRPADRTAPKRRAWRGPLLAAALCLLVLGAGLVILLPWLARPTAPEGPALEALRSAVEKARAHLGRGRFHLAKADLAQLPLAAFPADEARAIIQLRRQANLLAALSLVPVADIVRQARFVTDRREWAAQWTDHRGRAVLFDAALRRDVDGRPVFVNHVVMVDEEPVRVAMEDDRLLRDLPLDREVRVIFGVRLAACEREEAGWVIRLEPDGGVLFTDRPAAEAAFLTDLGPDLPEVLARQEAWLAARSR
jgi:hypothetical protein